jgi:UDP-N-acetylmuramoyl-tripeptide--D-alanyl-D-alanine ligase
VQLTAAWAAARTGGVVANERSAEASDQSAVAQGVSFDSRSMRAGEAFIALRAERDGHDFVADALARGAPFAIVERVPDGLEGDALVVVDDCYAALAALASAARAELEGATVIGVTGSVGKTSTKDMIAATLGSSKKVHASRASFNNEIGLPVTLIGTPPGTEVVVLEMGARFAGNIRHLCAIARPSIGVITNIGLAHAEHLGGPEGIARVKGELLESLPSDGLAVVDADSDQAQSLLARASARTISAGVAAGADVRILALEVDDDLHATFDLSTPWGPVPGVRLGVRGAHQAANAAKAAAVALSSGVTAAQVVDTLSRWSGEGLRMELIRTNRGFTVLNDCYNASPSAVAAAIDALERLPASGRRIAVLGEMLELGDIGPDEHARVGALAAEHGVDLLVAVGEGAAPVAAEAEGAGVAVRRAADAGEAVALLAETVRPGDVVLVKASRAVGLEQVARALASDEQEPPS